MGFLQTIGIALVAGSLIFQSYLLLTDKSSIQHFEGSVKNAVALPECKSLAVVLPHLTILRQALAGIQALAGLLVFARSSLIAFIVALAVIVQAIVLHNPLLERDPVKRITVIGQLVRSLAVIGGLFALIGSGRRVQKQK
eukprot:TRINITY_DN0_c2799_g1_i1.p1 TRINITY_DN0_c2799_g1~~TRINITY_DN0_c2799_g1_i1.p1  ORF type:complete len:140 (-),score=50.40 TRINITY_DN0_c2799_g1_i1:43-462(-)